MIPEGWFQAGEAFIRWVQMYRNPVLDFVFAVGSLMGEEVFFLLFLPLFYWNISPGVGRWLAYALLVSAYVNSGLKYLFLTPRPPEVYWHHVLRPESPGFPSGHAQVGTTVWGMLAAQYRRKWLTVGALVIIAVVSFSRIYNGVHYPHDVLGGLLIGAVLLFLLVRFGPYVVSASVAWSLPTIIGAITGVTLVLLLLHPSQGGRWPAPAAVTTTATAWGMSIGFVLEQRRVGFQVGALSRHHLLRSVVGLVGIALVYVGLRVITPEALATIGRFVRYALVGLLVAWGMPALFVRLGWATGMRRPQVSP